MAVDSEIREHLEKAVVELEGLFEPPLRLSEVFGAIDAIGEVVLTFQPNGTQGEYENLLREAFDWADEKFQIWQKIDDALKVGPLLEPFDQTVVKQVVYHIGIPQAARWLVEVQ